MASLSIVLVTFYSLHSWSWMVFLCKYIALFLGDSGNNGLLIHQAYMALNDIDAAVESFKKALDLEPNDGQWRFSAFIMIFFLFGQKSILCWMIITVRSFTFMFIIGHKLYIDSELQIYTVMGLKVGRHFIWILGRVFEIMILLNLSLNLNYTLITLTVKETF